MKQHLQGLQAVLPCSILPWTSINCNDFHGHHLPCIDVSNPALFNLAQDKVNEVGNREAPHGPQLTGSGTPQAAKGVLREVEIHSYQLLCRRYLLVWYIYDYEWWRSIDGTIGKCSTHLKFPVIRVNNKKKYDNRIWYSLPIRPCRSRGKQAINKPRPGLEGVRSMICMKPIRFHINVGKSRPVAGNDIIVSSTLCSGSACPRSFGMADLYFSISGHTAGRLALRGKKLLSAVSTGAGSLYFAGGLTDLPWRNSCRNRSVGLSLRDGVSSAFVFTALIHWPSLKLPATLKTIVWY